MPAIGVTTARLTTEYVEGFSLELLQARSPYVEKFFPADDVTVHLIPGIGDTAEKAALYLRRLDGLLVTGGSDINPEAYRAPRDPATGRGDAQRDAAELALTKEAERRGMPVLGICRGMQILNTHREGTLHQHLPDVVGTDIHQASSTRFSEHPVTLDEGSALARATGQSRVTVKTYHHQGIKDLGTGLRPVAWAEDGIIEAVETSGAKGRQPGKWAAMGVQWHPEAGEGDVHRAPFTWLAERAREYERRAAGHPTRSRYAGQGATLRTALGRRAASPNAASPWRAHQRFIQRRGAAQ
ncbi:gamma-glutamyl-gamma-aminobutyrate hydrolase family protein [Marinitenerispora sediminis]|uniref:Gamma-glutamyl-gamma-aminobutyrate hydrolase n=1 Tax=Marinitenerispora sediminis TaxID=1931232 RepID=A0A368SZ79_9ACTN|nr:gamma-glutamyl-gamma-aminobutyrate hydrolase family protein [Marinitenerispora sediminis]RCV48353.1 gamma-glutamyl-gamma-aminobutyrate hydrolase [Marinitenerispora sediminis]RCV49889.1 gamma-glutamyl-gamma-aminobutyrate hydrolase [Marinitenerispora sediminis]RCV50644.1 gamma-glutamyl-gamma-aminobutyrate hydrolase [Marinitenerispora sediminis]